MNVKGERKRILGTFILLIMVMLTVCTVTFVAIADEEMGTSYSLIIQKIFHADTPEKVLDEALKKEYVFEIKGTVQEKDDNGEKIDVPYSKTIVLNASNDADSTKEGWQSEKIDFGKPYNVTVTEITDDIVIEVDKESGDGKEYYNMSDSFSDSNISVDKRKHEVELKNNSTLVVRREKFEEKDHEPDLAWYHVTSRPEDSHDSGHFESLDEVFSLGAGESRNIEYLPSGDRLCPGIYTIEQIAAPDGYQLQMGERTEEVTAGNEGHFYINGTPGMLTLTAGGTKSDGAIHYYTIERTSKADDDTSEFLTRTIDIASGESWTAENLPKGGYKVTEYSSIEDANTAFSLTMPQTTTLKTWTGKSSALTDGNTRKWGYFDLSGEDHKDVNCVRMVNFGPLYDSSNTELSASDTYAAFYYAVPRDDGKIYTNDIKTHNRASGYKGSVKMTVSNAPKLRLSSVKQLKVAVTGVNSSTAKKIGVRWTEYEEKEVTKTFDKPGIPYTEGITIDDRGWMEITAPAPKEGIAANQFVYYYTLRNSKNKLITFDGATDKENTSLKLTAGQSLRLTGLAEGSYKITETVDWVNVGFTMKVTGAPFGVTEADKPLEVQVGGKRTVTISKPALTYTANGAADNRDYIFNISRSRFFETVSIKAGESETVTLPEKGKYTITPTNEKLGVYRLGYTDSASVYGTASGTSSVITFTNVFSKGEYGYRFVHEYYVREPDGTYTYEGNSRITTRQGCRQGDTHGAGEIDKVLNYGEGENQHKYIHFDEAYGHVDGIQPEADVQSDHAAVVNRASRTASASSAQKDSDNDSGRASRRKYRTASASSAREDSDDDYSVATVSSARERLSSEDADRSEARETLNDSRGIVSQGSGFDSGGKNLNYAPDSGMDRIRVTEDASQIIILRYYREREPEGTYKVIHVYYRRDIDGKEYREGDSKVRTRTDVLYSRHKGEEIDRETSFRPDGAETPYDYTWDLRPQYGVVDKTDNGNDQNEFSGDGQVYRPNTTWTSAEATEEGNQIIILRYYRDPSREGSYRVVHEYYFRKPHESHDSEEDGQIYAKAARNLDGSAETEEDGETEEDTPDISDEFTGTLDINDGFDYRFEGKTELESVTAPLFNTFTQDNVDRKINFGNEEYQFINAGYGTVRANGSYECNRSQEWAASTEEGNEVIILRYFRQTEPLPVIVSYKVVHEYYVQDSEGKKTLVGTSDIRGITDASADESYDERNVDREPVFRDNTYTYFDCGYGTVSEKDYGEIEGKQYVRATVSGEEIIILRYVRTEEPKTPENPPNNPPDNPSKPKKNSSRDPEPPSEPPKTPAETPGAPEETPETAPGIPETFPEITETPPEIPDYPTRLPDPNDPNSPDEITIMEDGVPLTYIKKWDPEKEEWVYILDDETPLAAMDLPKTGDSRRIAFWTALAAASLCGLAVLSFMRRKQRYT